jgi:hypothetical protein
MENTNQKYYLQDSNPLDIIYHNVSKLSALNTLITSEGVSLELSDISDGLYFLLSDIEDQLLYASRRIEKTNAAHRSAAIS